MNERHIIAPHNRPSTSNNENSSFINCLAKDYVLFEDSEIPFKQNDDDCLSETSQIFIEEPMEVGEESQLRAEKCFNESVQNGSGMNERHIIAPRDRPSTSNNENSSFIICNEAVSLIQRHRRHNKRFNAEEISYEASIDFSQISENIRGIQFCSALQVLRRLLSLIIDQATVGLTATDLIRICIQSDVLDRPISTCLLKVMDMTVEKILSCVYKVVQSKTTLCLDQSLKIDVITVKRPVGGGKWERKRRVINIAVDRLNKKSVISVPMDGSVLCCAKAIIYGLAVLRKDRTAIESYRKVNRPALRKKAEELHRELNLPLEPCGLEQIALFENKLGVQICVMSSDNFNQVIYSGRVRAERINLWLHNNHYDIIKSLTGFYGSNFYCLSCNVPYQNETSHMCSSRCYVCLRDKCSVTEEIRCNECERVCRSIECYERHKDTSGQKVLSICDKIYQCRRCCKIIRRKDCPKEKHVCNLNHCPSCKKMVQTDNHKCFLNKIAPKAPNSKFIFFDLETDQSTGEHIVNFAVSQKDDGTENIFSGYTALHEFCSFLFVPKHKNYTVIAHNLQGFDGQFILGWLLEQGLKPTVIPNGSKFLSIKVKALNISFIDSFSFLPMPLSRLPESFGIKELCKGYFPHLFNRPENQNYCGPIPDSKFYAPESMSVENRKNFFIWYDEQKNTDFDFQKEMLMYCRSDVDILRRCCLEFRTLFMNLAGVDPFQYVTLPSACMASYRANHVPKDKIAMVPIAGYLNRTNYSRDSIRWLEYEAKMKNINIRHALNGNGEVKIKSISVDGFCAETKTVFLYQGCFYHGCNICYESHTLNPVTHTPMGVLFSRTKEIVDKLKNDNFIVIQMWEHDFQLMKKTDQTLKNMSLELEIEDRLNPRNAFYGGRTNAVKLYSEGTIKYIDFTSLYPWVNKYCSYPVGHPVIITENFQDISEYFGIAKCKIEPPKGLFHPVLPYRMNDKLMFPLCRRCAETMNQGICEHTREERSLTGTWVTEEIKVAVKKGYKIIKMYEIYHFTEQSKDLFSTYIDRFLKVKQEASGWPAHCISEAEKKNYIEEYKRIEGIVLDLENICKNPGKRQVAKLALNAFWGRWGMNMYKSHIDYLSSISELNKLMTDSSKNIKDMYLPSANIAAVQWETKKDFIVRDTATNIFIAAFTTCHARLKLYSEIEKLGDAVLYFDTDSIIYESCGTNDPPTGNFLGQFTDELNGDTIKTFVSGGPKNYAYETAGGEKECKIRGFTLNFKNMEKLNFSTVNDIVTNLDFDASIVLHNPRKISRDPKTRTVFNKEEFKTYKMCYTKRVIRENYSTVPYGF